MSDDFDVDEDEQVEEKKNPLRPVLKQKEKALNEALARLAKYEAQERQSTVAELIKEAGGDPRYAKFYNSDDSSPESVKAWIQSEAELLGVSTEKDQETDLQVQRLTDAVNTAPVQRKAGSTADVISQIQSAKNADEFWTTLVGTGISRDV